jgi:coproporphyrinogen III oxidase-like Fe-S oxidoreductase
LDPVRYTDAMLTRGSAIVERDVLTPTATYVESLVAGLRTREGADLDAVLRRTGLDPRIRHRDHLEYLTGSGLAEVTESHLVLSLEGIWVLDAILEPFLDVLDPAS